MDVTRPLLLKADLVASGVSLTNGLDVTFRTSSLPGAGLDIALPAGVIASVPVVSPEHAGAYRLAAVGDRFSLETPPDRGGASIDVRVRPASRFSAQVTSRGTPMHRIAERRGRTLLVSPLGRCGYSITGQPCTFCIEGGRAVTADAAATPADVVETVGAVMREDAIDVVLFNTDSAEGDDGGVAFLTPYVHAVRRHAPVLVAAQLHPPRTTAWVDRTYALGLDAVSYGLELYDAGAFSRLCVGRARYIGRERYLTMLARAAEVFPRGAVWSELVVGVEPPEHTLAGIDALAEMGVVPVLALPRASSAPPRLASAATLTALATRLAEATSSRHVSVTWIRDLGASITPADVHRLSGAEGGSLGRMRASIAARSARSLSRIRRRLRVRRADASAPSH